MFYGKENIISGEKLSFLQWIVGCVVLSHGTTSVYFSVILTSFIQFSVFCAELHVSAELR